MPDEMLGPLLDPCAGDTAYPRDADRVVRTGIGLTALPQAGGTDLRQTVARCVLVVGYGEDGDPGVAIAWPFAAIAAEKLPAVVAG